MRRGKTVAQIPADIQGVHRGVYYRIEDDHREWITLVNTDLDGDGRRDLLGTTANLVS